MAAAADDLEKILSEEKSLEDRKRAVIEGLLKEKAAAIKAFDDKLAKLGYQPDRAKPRRNHHRKAAAETPKAKG